MNQKHEFALYCAQLSHNTSQKTITITDADLVHRVSSVLRLQQGEQCILFDEQVHVLCVLQTITKKQIVAEVQHVRKNQQLQPTITCLLPLLKREDLEAAITACVEFGASHIQLVTTEKVQRTWAGAKEFERLQRIMIAAAEQSKNFALPMLHQPQPLAQAVAATQGEKIFFDVGGQPALPVIHHLAQQKAAAVTMIVGPEGDLTPQEKALLAEQQFTTCQLTPTVLRAVSAHMLGLGILRSCLQ